MNVGDESEQNLSLHKFLQHPDFQDSDDFTTNVSLRTVYRTYATWNISLDFFSVA